MAITTDDFNKIWASTSPLTPYSFSASQYKEGWNFIGSTPPSRQMWDFLQKNNDEKMQYLLNNFDNYLPLSGGTMSGAITTSAVDFIKKTSNTSHVTILGGTEFSNSASLMVAGGSQSYATGCFELKAQDGSNSSALTGKPDGTLTWNNKEIERVSAKGTYGIRFESGIQICWGTLSIPAGTAGREVSDIMTFPYPFANANYGLTFGNDWRASSSEYCRAEGRNTANFKFTAVGVGTNAHNAFYIAIGFWK